MSGSLDLGSLILRVTANTDSAQKGLNSVADQAERVVNRFDNLNRVGQSLSSIGSTLTKTLTVPLVALGTTVAKLGTDFEYSMAKVQAITGATGAEFEKLENLARDIGANTQFSAREAAEGMTYLAMAGWDTNQMLAGYESIVQLSIATTTDLARCSDIVTDALTAMGYSAEDTGHFCDVLAKASMNSNTNVDMMGESFKYVASIAGTLGYSVEDLAVALGILANAGIKSSQSGTTLRKILTNLASPTDEAAALMEQYGISMFDSEGNARDLGDVLTDLRKAFSGLTEEEKAQAAETIAGTQALSGFMALINASDEDFAKLTQEINNADGATKEMADTMAKTTQGKIKAMISALEECALQLADILLPAIQKVVEWITNLAKKFQSLSPATKKAIVTLAAFAAAIGPVLSIGGKLITLCSSIGAAFSAAAGAGSVLGGAMALLSSVTVPVVAILGTLAVAAAGVATYTETMNQSVLVAEEDMGLMEKAVAKLTGTVTYNKDELKEMGAIYDDFNENISPEFQQAVQDMHQDFADFSLDINKFNLDGVITEEEANALIERVSGTIESCVKAVESKQESMNDTLKNLLGNDGVWSEIDQQTLEYWDNYYNTNAEEAQRIQEEINQIIQDAAANGRELTPEEEKAIRDKYARIKQIELECAANNQYEMEYAHNEFNNRLQTLDAEGAAKLAQQRQGDFQEQQIQTKSQYETLIQMEKDQQANMSAEELIASEERIKNLENARDAELKKNQEYYDADIQAIVDYLGEAGVLFDKYNLDIMDKQDKTCNEQFEMMKSHYGNLNSVTEDGLYKMYNSTTKTYDDLIVNIDEDTGEIIGITKTWTDEYGIHTDEITGYNSDLKDSTNDMQSQMVQDINRIKTGMADGSLSYNESTGEVVDANGDVVASMSQVVDENGNVVDTILDINGTPVNITGNWVGAKAGADSVADAVKNIPSSKTVTVTTNYIQKYNSQGPGPTMLAEGTDSAQAGPTIVGEAGPELILSRSGQAMLANSATLMNMAGGEKVYTATETARIFKNMEKLSDFLAMQSASVSASYRGASKSDIREVVNEILDVASVGSDRPINVALNLDSKILAKTMVKPIEREIGRMQKGRSYNRGANLT